MVPISSHTLPHACLYKYDAIHAILNPTRTFPCSSVLITMSSLPYIQLGCSFLPVTIPAFSPLHHLTLQLTCSIPSSSILCTYLTSNRRNVTIWTADREPNKFILNTTRKNLKGRYYLDRPRCRWEYNITVDDKEVGCDADWINLAHVRGPQKGCCEQCNVKCFSG